MAASMVEKELENLWDSLPDLVHFFLWAQGQLGFAGSKKHPRYSEMKDIFTKMKNAVMRSEPGAGILIQEFKDIAQAVSKELGEISELPVKIAGFLRTMKM